MTNTVKRPSQVLKYFWRLLWRMGHGPNLPMPWCAYCECWHHKTADCITKVQR